MSLLNSFVEGMRAYRAGEYSTAVELLGRLVRREDVPGRLARYYSAMSHRAMGIAHLRSGQFIEAGRRFRQAVALIGNRSELAEYLFFVYARSGQYERCAEQAEVVARSNRDDVPAQIRLAQGYWRSRRRSLAIMTLTAALRRLGDSAELHLQLGLFHAAEDDYDTAREHLLRAVERDCTSAEAHRRLGLIECARGDFPAAVKAFQRAWVLRPEDMMTAYQLCLAADAASRLPTVGDAPAARTITIALPESRHPPQASLIGQLAEYAADEPDFVEALLALPPSDVDEELFEVVMLVLATALARHADQAELHYLAGVVSMRLGRSKPARDHLLRAIEIDPTSVKAMLRHAELDAGAGEVDRAIKYLDRAIRAGGDWPDVHVRLGDLMRHRGMAESAGSHYRRALELNGRYDRAAERLASLAA